jgi:transcriptional regulator with XRE-family HTH domain
MEWEKLAARNIRRLRKERGYSQEHLAHEAEITMRYLVSIEQGEANPSIKVVGRIANVLGVPLGALFATDQGDS